MITLVLGGARSGKSAVAERLALRHPAPVLYLATATLDPDDLDMAARVEAHRARRGDRFITVEAGADLAGALRRAGDRPVLVDALGTWLAASSGAPEDDGFTATATTRGPELVAELVGRPAPTVVVSDEVGLGVHPASEMGRRFRDALGLINQQVAAVADEMLLVVAGRILRLDPLDALDALDLPVAPDAPDARDRP